MNNKNIKLPSVLFCLLLKITYLALFFHMSKLIEIDFVALTIMNKILNLFFFFFFINLLSHL